MARNYDPLIGRFLQRDPVLTSYTYTYANNNPLKFIDPEGTAPYFAKVPKNVIESSTSPITNRQPITSFSLGDSDYTFTLEKNPIEIASLWYNLNGGFVGFSRRFPSGAKKVHEGLDVSALRHTPVASVLPGRIVAVGFSPPKSFSEPGYGLYVFIEHEVDGQKYYSFYAHLSLVDANILSSLSERAIKNLEMGYRGQYEVDYSVGEGEFFAASGTSGIIGEPRSGPHLHFGLSTLPNLGTRWYDVNPFYHHWKTLTYLDTPYFEQNLDVSFEKELPDKLE